MESRAGGLRSALFVDRDGVVNVDHGHVHREEDFVFVEGIFSLVRAAVRAGLVVVVITNQAGIGRGYYSQGQFGELTRWMRARFEEEGAPIDAVYYCPDHPEYGVGPYRRDSFDRKPNPGMLLRAREQLGIDLSSSLLVGDKASDVQAARAAGVGTAILFGEPTTGIDPAPDVYVSTLAQVEALIEARRPRGA